MSRNIGTQARARAGAQWWPELFVWTRTAGSDPRQHRSCHEPLERETR